MSMRPLDLSEIRARIEKLKATPLPSEQQRECARIEDVVQRAQSEAQIRRAKSLSIVGERFAGRAFATVQVTPGNRLAIEAARRVAANPRLGLGLYGRPGTGKTHLAGAIARSCIERGIPAVVDSVSGILMRIRSTYDDGSHETEHGLIQRIAEVPVLVLDDLGKERLTDWSAQMLWEIANARYERGNPVVITTNCGLDALLQRYAQRIKGVDEFTLPAMMERLVEMSGDWIEVRGESRRWLRSAHGGAA